MRKCNSDEVRKMIAEGDIVVIHLDALWNGQRIPIENKIQQIVEMNPLDVQFAYVDSDEEQEFARSMELKNVPTVAYFRRGKLIATVIGQGQDVAGNIGKVRDGALIGTSNRLSRS